MYMCSLYTKQCHQANNPIYSFLSVSKYDDHCHAYINFLLMKSQCSDVYMR